MKFIGHLKSSTPCQHHLSGKYSPEEMVTHRASLVKSFYSRGIHLTAKKEGNLLASLGIRKIKIGLPRERS